MKIAVITGASSGLGKEFALAVSRKRRELDEIWLIARREDKLIELSESMSKRSRIIALDLTDGESLEKFKTLLETEKPTISLLINNAGFGKIGNFEKISADDSGKMVRLNCESLTVMTSLSVPYMAENSEIINSCSISAFAPNPGMAVYSSTKAYVMSFSKALRYELKNRRINVLAVCPGPMDTEFMPVAGITPGVSRAFDTLSRVDVKEMAEKSLDASSKRRSVYTNKPFYKFYRFFAKLLPHGFVMRFSGV